MGHIAVSPCSEQLEKRSCRCESSDFVHSMIVGSEDHRRSSMEMRVERNKLRSEMQRRSSSKVSAETTLSFIISSEKLVLQRIVVSVVSLLDWTTGAALMLNSKGFRFILLLEMFHVDARLRFSNLWEMNCEIVLPFTRWNLVLKHCIVVAPHDTEERNVSPRSNSRLGWFSKFCNSFVDDYSVWQTISCFRRHPYSKYGRFSGRQLSPEFATSNKMLDIMD